jgi:hypothetical protein
LTAFDLATDSLFNDPNLATDALYRVGGAGPALALRVVRAMPDGIAKYGDGRFVVDTVLLSICVSDAPELSAGDTVEIAGVLHEIRGTPTRDTARLVWLAEAGAL